MPIFQHTRIKFIVLHVSAMLLQKGFGDIIKCRGVVRDIER